MSVTSAFRPSAAWREGDDPGHRQFRDIGPLELERSDVCLLYTYPSPRD